MNWKKKAVAYYSARKEHCKHKEPKLSVNTFKNFFNKKTVKMVFIKLSLSS